MRKTLIALATLLALLAITTAAWGHHGPATTAISAAAKKQPAVPFNHGKHATTLVKSCDTCHHTQKGLTRDSDKDVKKCTTCHLDPKAGVPSMREMSMQKNPFHMVCVDCHKEQKKGPAVCTGCHVKK